MSNKIFKRVVLGSWVWILGLAMAVSFLEEWLMFIYQDSYHTDLVQKASFAFVDFLSVITLILVIPATIHSVSLKRPLPSIPEFTKRNFLPLLVETIRMYAFLIIWLMALVVPAFYKYARYHFYPFVVYFDEDYKGGKLDALDRSSELVAGHTLFIFFLLMVEGVLALFISGVPERFEGIYHAPVNFIFTLLTTLVSVYTYCVYYNLFSLKLKRFKAANQPIEGQANESNL